ncbi:ATP-binding protein [Phenylobacterium sp.]|uniref:ATP-binding protein n=1 Tax=Phenylobacterium sp. TaxID=1871053 RepID=UPI002C856DF5|nr:ATP-binding protein [Phenylobacterium sp.]HVI30657.1 ATP-binding protein [Phenylobacterium sp.]
MTLDDPQAPSGEGLRYSPEDLLTGVLKMSSEGVVVVDADQRILVFSDGAEAIFGYAADEIRGELLERLMPHRFRSDHATLVRDFGRGSRDSIIMSHRGVLVGLRKSGEEFPLEASVSRQVTCHGVLYTAIVRDVSARLKQEAVLRSSERRLRLATETANLQVFEIDFRNRTLTADGAPSLFDPPLRFEDVGADVWAAIDPSDRPSAKAAWEEHRLTGQPFRLEVQLNRPQRPRVWALLSAELVRDEAGEPTQLVGAIQDVTERRLAERAAHEAAAEAQAANAAKTSFLATMSHEIRTPLNGVLGMAQAMAIDQLSPVQRERLEVLRQSGEALLAIVNDVLDLAKIESGKLEIEHAPFDLGQLIHGLDASFAPLAADKGVVLRVDPGDADRIYEGDPTRIRQILANLLSNALKFTERGEVRLQARDAGGELRIEVSDTGIGIAPEAMPNLFQVFAQADASTTRRFGGTGLGLAISRQLAERMNGRLTVTSSPGVGSTFTLALPLPVATRAVAGAGDGPADLPLASVRVLVAEDNPVNRLVISTLLAQLDLKVTVVENGRLAVEAWRAEPYDLVLMDVQMPELDGPDAAREIRQLEVGSGRARTPIIGLTANAMTHQVDGYLAAGMDSVVTKPIELPKLVEAMQTALAARGL